jgi:lycopene beta-cyclase
MSGMRRLEPTETTLIVLWVLTLIVTPITYWLAGREALIRMVSAGVLMQATTVGIIFVFRRGWKASLAIFVPVLVLAWAVEWLGSSTGFPFGRYQYTNVLQPQLANVPLIIPLAWMMMLPPAWAIASVIVTPGIGQVSWRVRAIKAAVAALAFTAWDLALDPQMVMWGFWSWEIPGSYFGIPLVNFLGWWLVSFLLSFGLLPDNMPSRPFLFVYGLTWLLQSVGLGFFWHLPGPATVCFLGMGAMLLWAILRRRL